VPVDRPTLKAAGTCYCKVQPGEFIPMKVNGKTAFLFLSCPKCGMKNTITLWEQSNVAMDDRNIFSLDPGVDCLDTRCGTRIRVQNGLFA
jgi:hypothetical protein